LKKLKNEGIIWCIEFFMIKEFTKI
jgi:hypothetical protein